MDIYREQESGEFLILSIIIAAYNAERTLGRLVKSIADQRLNRCVYELIIVNDGSTDGTAEEIEALQRMYSMVPIKKVTIPNSGVCVARNRGITMAKGQYITFADSDDYYGDGVLQCAMNTFRKFPDVELWKYGNIEHYFEHGTELGNRKNDVPGTIVYTPKDSVDIMLDMEKVPLFGYVWNSFYKRHIIEIFNIRFSGAYIMEDFMFSFKYLKHCSSVGTMKGIYYHYMLEMDKESLSKQFESQYYEMYRLKVAHIYQYMKAIDIQDNAMYRKLADLYVRYIYSSLARIQDSEIISRRERLQEVWQDCLYRVLRPYMCLSASLIGILSGLLKYHLSAGALFCVHLISFVKRHCAVLFATFKSR